MYGTLSEVEALELLRQERIGRLGIQGDGTVYVFPVCYGFDGTKLYFHSRDGMKVRLMREHPAVCFEVEDVTSPVQWRTVMVHGTYHEVTEEAERDLGLSLIAGQGDVAAPPSLAPYLDGPESIVVGRLDMAQMTARFEHDYPLIHEKASNGGGSDGSGFQ